MTVPKEIKMVLNNLEGKKKLKFSKPHSWYHLQLSWILCAKQYAKGYIPTTCITSWCEGFQGVALFLVCRTILKKNELPVVDQKNGHRTGSRLRNNRINFIYISLWIEFYIVTFYLACVTAAFPGEKIGERRLCLTVGNHVQK